MVEHPGLSFTDVPAGVLPEVPFVPSVHLNYPAAVLPMKDGLPKLRDFPLEAGGSDEVVPDAQHLSQDQGRSSPRLTSGAYTSLLPRRFPKQPGRYEP